MLKVNESFGAFIAGIRREQNLTLAWVAHMNSLKVQAEEIVLRELIYEEASYENS